HPLRLASNIAANMADHANNTNRNVQPARDRRILRHHLSTATPAVALRVTSPCPLPLSPPSGSALPLLPPWTNSATNSPLPSRNRAFPCCWPAKTCSA